MGLQNTLHALADPTRRQILDMLKKGRMAAGEIAGNLPMTGATVSHHLSVLKDADLIFNQREGKFIYYELNTSVLEDIILWISTLKGEDHVKSQSETDHSDLTRHSAAAAGGSHSVEPSA